MLLSKKILLAIVLLATITAVGFAFYHFRPKRTFQLPKVKKLKVPHFSIDPNESHFLGKVMAEKKGVSVILFFRYGCHFSRGFLPTFQKLAAQEKELGVFFGAVEVNNDDIVRTQEKKKIAEELGLKIVTFPYIAIFKDGVVMHIMEGDEQARNEENIKKILKKTEESSSPS